jgi:hypothetical protein
VRTLSRRKAELALAAVRKHVRDDGPVLYEPGHEGNHWAISWEEGHEDWIFNLEGVVWPPGVGWDRYNHFALCIYPEEL